MAIKEVQHIRSVIHILSTLNLSLIALRQFFDLLGRLWLPAIFNFVQIVATILAYFGVSQRRPTFILIYLIWTLIGWISWNAFLICLYLNVGQLDTEKHDKFLHFDSISPKIGKSWWAKNVPGCERFYNATLGQVVMENCLIAYNSIEVICAAVHIVLALLMWSACGSFVVFIHHSMEDRKYRSVSRKVNASHFDLQFFRDKDQWKNTNNDISRKNAASLDNLNHEIISGYSNVSYDSSPATRINYTLTNSFISSGQQRQSVMIPNYKRSITTSKDRRNSLPSRITKSGLVSNKASANDCNTFRHQEPFTAQIPENRRISTKKYGDQTITVELSPYKTTEKHSKMPSLNCYSKPSASGPNSNAPSTIYQYSMEPKRRINEPVYNQCSESRFPIGNYLSDNFRASSDDSGRQSYEVPSNNAHNLLTFDPKGAAGLSTLPNHIVSGNNLPPTLRQQTGICTVDQLFKDNNQSFSTFGLRKESSSQERNLEDTTSRNSQSHRAYETLSASATEVNSAAEHPVGNSYVIRPDLSNSSEQAMLRRSEKEGIVNLAKSSNFEQNNYSKQPIGQNLMFDRFGIRTDKNRYLLDVSGSRGSDKKEDGIIV